MHDATSLLGDFSGRVRLFPLPNLVLFPHVVQPLHVFEERYRQLTADALAGDRLITMAFLKSDQASAYDHRPPIHPAVCVGRVFKEERLPDGRYHLLLQGVARARVVEELPIDKLYREALVELTPEVAVSMAEQARQLRQRLRANVEQWFATQSDTREQLRKLLASQMPLGTLCDIFSFVLPIASEKKQELLAEIDVARRVERFLKHLDATPPASETATAQRRFPPDFSNN